MGNQKDSIHGMRMDINNEGPIKGGGGGEGVVSLSICDMKFGPIFPKLVKFTQVNSFLKTIPIFWGQNNDFFCWKTSTDAQEEVIQAIWMRKKRMKSKLRN